MINARLFTVHNLLVIGVIAILWHVAANPIYAKLSGKLDNAG